MGRPKLWNQKHEIRPPAGNWYPADSPCPAGLPRSFDGDSAKWLSLCRVVCKLMLRMSLCKKINYALMPSGTEPISLSECGILSFTPGFSPVNRGCAKDEPFQRLSTHLQMHPLPLQTPALRRCRITAKTPSPSPSRPKPDGSGTALILKNAASPTAKVGAPLFQTPPVKVVVK